MSENKGKIVLITGGTSGFGKATAVRMISEGAKVIITGRKKDVTAAVAAEIGADYICADAGVAADWERVRDHIQSNYGRLDVLINNAGTGVVIKDLTEQSIDDIDLCMRVNMMGPIYCIHYLAPMMKQQHSGTIINLSSVCAKHAWEGYSVYAAAKAGVLNLSKSAYVELQSYGIRVTCVIPGAGETNFQINAQEAPMQHNEKNLQSEDMAQVICDICALPEHVVVEDVTVWGTAQVIRPL